MKVENQHVDRMKESLIPTDISQMHSDLPEFH